MNKQQKPALRRYFFDTEFNDSVGQFACDLISVGFVAEDGREYYGISKEFNVAAANSIPWIKKNVMDKLDDQSKWVGVDTIRKKILAMIEPAAEVELWARNGSYDNVMLCQIFGGMGPLFDAFKKKGVNKVTFRDMHELTRQAPNVKMWQQDSRGEHIAINDARHERFTFKVYSEVIEAQGEQPPPHLPHVNGP